MAKKRKRVVRKTRSSTRYLVSNVRTADGQAVHPAWRGTSAAARIYSTAGTAHTSANRTKSELNKAAKRNRVNERDRVRGQEG